MLKPSSIPIICRATYPHILDRKFHNPSVLEPDTKARGIPEGSIPFARCLSVKGRVDMYRQTDVKYITIARNEAFPAYHSKAASICKSM